MEYFNYSPSIFADEIGVIRSSISHIISGRNNPGLELLQKVLIRFPQISSDWLLLGRGEMVLSDDEFEKKKLTNVNYPKKIGQLNLMDFTSEKTEPEPATVKNESHAMESSSPKPQIESVISAVQPVQPPSSEPVAQATAIKEKTAASPSSSKIKRITVYFDDHSFHDYVEDKKD